MKHYLPCIKCGKTVERVSDIKNAVCFDCKSIRRRTNIASQYVTRMRKKKMKKKEVKEVKEKNKFIQSRYEYFVNGVSNIVPL